MENYAYYESLGYDKQYSKDGVIWADYECTFPELSQNTTLYGHNWYNIYTPRTLENMQSNDLMFSLVMSYHYTDFAQQNPFIYFSHHRAGLCVPGLCGLLHRPQLRL